MVQALSRSWRVFHGPHRSSTSHQGAPVRSFQDPFDHLSVVAPPAALAVGREQWCDGLPCFVREFSVSNHVPMVNRFRVC